MGQAENGLGSWESAVEHLRRSLSLSPDNFEPRMELARILSQHDQLDEAELHIDRALQLRPADSEAQELKMMITLRKSP